MRIARVMVTKGCNFKCEYCCNEWDGMFESFKPITLHRLSEIAEDFDGINITGGEPLLLGGKLVKIISSIKNPSIRLYTNGSLLTFEMYKYLVKAGVKKFEVGIHDLDRLMGTDLLELMLARPEMFRVSINEEYAKKINNFLNVLNMYEVEINLWKMDECDNADTDRFLLEEII